MIRAVLEPHRSFEIVRRRTLFYRDGASVELDRSAHVRAASSLVWVGKKLVAVQDDANFLAVIDPESGEVESVTLPPSSEGHREFDDLRGNKKSKLDFEGAFTVKTSDGIALYALGSGSIAGTRDYILRARFDETLAILGVELVFAGSFYEMLRSTLSFSGSELNLEGALVRGEKLLLLQRGNGAPHGDILPVSAFAEVNLRAFLTYLEAPTTSDPPLLENVTAIDLSSFGRLTLTDAALTEDGSLVVIGAEEASPDATRDGIVSRVAIAFVEGDEVRCVFLRSADGSLLADKIEGIAALPNGAFHLVVDADDPRVPATLLTVAPRSRA